MRLPQGMSYSTLCRYRALRAGGLPARQSLYWARTMAGIATTLFAHGLWRDAGRAEMVEEAYACYCARRKIYNGAPGPHATREAYLRWTWQDCYLLARSGGNTLEA